jgi:hypothetical protein
LAHWDLPWLSHIWRLPSEQTIAFQIQENALEEMLTVENAITTPFQDFELVVQPFDKTAVGSMDKVIGDFLPPTIEHFQEFIETG